MKDTDTKVQDHLEKNGGYEKLWKNFEDDIYENPYDSTMSLNDFKKKVCIVRCPNGKVRSGRNTAKFGKQHDYFPFMPVFITIFLSNFY